MHFGLLPTTLFLLVFFQRKALCMQESKDKRYVVTGYMHVLVYYVSVKCIRDCICEFSSFNRYIFYDVNPGEGFNLRRDVFMRMAVMVKKLNDHSQKFSYTLVRRYISL